MTLLGRLVADPEIKQTRSGKDYVRYSLATTDSPAPPGENGGESRGVFVELREPRGDDT